jgi:hypothetical protein
MPPGDVSYVQLSLICLNSIWSLTGNLSHMEVNYGAITRGLYNGKLEYNLWLLIPCKFHFISSQNGNQRARNEIYFRVSECYASAQRTTEKEKLWKYLFYIPREKLINGICYSFMAYGEDSKIILKFSQFCFVQTIIILWFTFFAVMETEVLSMSPKTPI